MKSTVIPYKIYQQLSPEMKKHLEQRGNYIVTDIIAGQETQVYIPMKGSLTHWDVNRVGRIVLNPAVGENPYKPSYDNLLENSKATREAIEQKERETKDNIDRYLAILHGQELKSQKKYPNVFIPPQEEQMFEYDIFRNQHIKEAREARTELEYEQEKIDRIGIIPYVLGNIARQIGLLPKETPNKKGNFKIVDFHNEELGKANNLKDAIFIFKQVYKYCRDEDALPFIYEE